MPLENIIFGLMGVFFAATCGTIISLWITNAVANARHKDEQRFRRLLESGLSSGGSERISALFRKNGMRLVRAYAWVSQTIRLPDSAVQRILQAFEDSDTDLRLMRELHDRRLVRRMRAATYLAYIPSERAGRALNLALAHESSPAVKLRIVFALVQHRHTAAIPTIIDSLSGSGTEYQTRARALLVELGEALEAVLPTMAERREPEVQRIFIDLAAFYPSSELQRYIEHLVREALPEVSRDAFKVLATHYTHSVDLTEYLESEDRFQRNLAVESLGYVASERSIQRLVPYLGVPETQKSAVVALSELIRRTPRFYTKVVDHFRHAADVTVQRGLAEVLAPRAEYLITTALREGWSDAQRLISLMLQTRRATGVLSLLNRNADEATEYQICRLIAPVVRKDEWLREEFGLYANDSVVRRLGIERQYLTTERGERRRENANAAVLVGLLFAVVVAPAVGYSIWWVLNGGAITLSLGIAYMNGFERIFAGYAFMLNTIYLSLLIVAAFAVTREHLRRELRPLPLLFRRGMLPSVSIVVPAYNEERTIAESVSGLLNLRYSDYEVIVVNDGSTDETLQTVIDKFQLERSDIFVHNYLSTRPIRGVYRNPRIPGLLLIDKSNGGKADSLNAGINAAHKEYFAAIDSDSILERDALLHLAADALDSEAPVIASGGNILPVNGCLVEEGEVSEIRLPRKLLPAFQMVEYIRAFMTGRTAWARLGTLLIISGAFGMFRKADVVDAGGYLTSSERFTKDTVAEDMELVVRVTRHLRVRGEPYHIHYAAHANCWTEVPESMRVLGAQRDRWQRGLIDILLYHSRLLLNPRYGRTGLVGFPYYYVFELFGPWIEIQGYILFLLGVVFGLLPVPVVAAVLTATIGLGVLNSVVAFQLAEWRHKLFRPRDRIAMAVLAVLENLGYRQYANLLRLRGYLSALRRRTGWGTMRRSGFMKKGA